MKENIEVTDNGVSILFNFKDGTATFRNFRIEVLLPEGCSFRVAIEHVKKAMESPLAGPSGSLENGSLHRKDVVKIPYLTVHAESLTSFPLD